MKFLDEGIHSLNNGIPGWDSNFFDDFDDYADLEFTADFISPALANSGIKPGIKSESADVEETGTSGLSDSPD